MKERKWIGTIDIKTGEIMVTDPLYVDIGSIKGVRKKDEKTLVKHYQNGNTYNEMINSENELAAISFPSGLGHGSYDLYATYDDVPFHGKRITKVEIELIPDWELNQMIKLEGCE
ncbi:hypothetical protein QO179_24190 [Bacillus stercoris]|nr:hypothetical protein [Bacillus stercoris]